MYRATFHFYGELNFFLPRSLKDQVIEHHFDWRGSVKDMIESIGIPHPEIERIIVNSQPVAFAYIVRPDDAIHVHPDLNGTASLLRQPFPGRFRFVLDQHLGRLAAYLRMLGFDTLYRNDYHDEELAQISHDQQRVLLTRDTGLLKRNLVVYGRYVRATDRHLQLAEIAGRFTLTESIDPFRHCMKCNGILEPISKSTVADRLPPGTDQHYAEFHRCQSCARVYWKGPHYQRMLRLMEQVLQMSGR